MYRTVVYFDKRLCAKKLKRKKKRGILKAPPANPRTYMCFTPFNTKKNSFSPLKTNQTQRLLLIYINCETSIFLLFLPFSSFFAQKCKNKICQPAFGVCSTQTPIKIYNTEHLRMEILTIKSQNKFR